MNELLAPLLATEEKSGIVLVAYDKKPMAIQALSMLHFQQTSAQGADPVQGQASYVIGSGPSGWVGVFTSQGYMVMVSRASVPTGNVQAMMTKNPQTIANYATEEGGYVIVDGPADLASRAMQIKIAGQTPPACPGGQAWAPAQNACVPIPGGVENGAAKNGAAAAATKAPSWLVPVAVAAGVLVVGALVLKR
jgi:hypothetical protein